MKTNYLTASVTQRGDPTLNNSIRRRWFALALGGFLFSAVLALSPSPLEAQCQQWSVGHGWRFKQGPTNVDLDLHQNETVITGTAKFRYSGESKQVGFYSIGGESGEVHGYVDGTVQGDSFAVIIHWNNNTTGVYNGTIRPSGKIEGTGYEQRSPSVKVNWYSTGVMKCADAAPATPKPADSAATKAELNAAADAWLEQERLKRKTATQPSPSASNKPRGFINGLQLGTPTPTPSAKADKSSTDDNHKKNKKKNKKKHHHHDDDENQDNN